MQIVERRAASARPLHFVPGLVRKPLDVVRQVARQLDDRRAEALAWAETRAAEARVDERGKLVGRDLLESKHRAGLVEGAPWPEHPFHEAGLRAGEHVADLALMLDRGAHRVLHGSAVEASDRLELVERHDDLATARVRQPRRELEDFLRQARDVAL